MDEENDKADVMVLAVSNQIWEHTGPESVLREFKNKNPQDRELITRLVFGIFECQSPELGVYEKGYIRLETEEKNEDEAPHGAQTLHDVEIWIWEAKDGRIAKRMFLYMMNRVNLGMTRVIIDDRRLDPSVSYEGRAAIEQFFAGDLVDPETLYGDGELYGDGIRLSSLDL